MKIRWFYLGLGALITLFLGLIYAWSLFVAPIEADLGLSRADTAMTFTISMSCFAIGTVVGSLIQKKVSVRTTLLISALLIALGFIICSNISNLGGIFLSYGVVLSFGIGVCYITVLGLINKWFLDRVGTASGVLLMGYGMGSFILGGAARFLFDALGWRTTFFVIGIAFGVLLALSSFILKEPDGSLVFPEPKKGRIKKEEPGGLELSPLQMIRRPVFWIFFTWCVLLLAAGLAVIGNAATFADSIGASVTLAVAATGMVSVCNGLGRLLFGWLFDVIGRQRCMFIDVIFFISGMSLLLLSANIGSLPLLFVGYALTGLAFGAIPTTNSALTMSFFGAKNYAINFSITALSIIPAALLGPYVAGLLITSGGGYATIFSLMLGISILALVLGFLIKKPKAQGEASEV